MPVPNQGRRGLLLPCLGAFPNFSSLHDVLYVSWATKNRRDAHLPLYGFVMSDLLAGLGCQQALLPSFQYHVERRAGSERPVFCGAVSVFHDYSLHLFRGQAFQYII